MYEGRTTNMKKYFTVAEKPQLSLNSGETNVDCNGEMVSVRDNGTTNNDDITTTPQQKINISYIGGEDYISYIGGLKFHSLEQGLDFIHWQLDFIHWGVRFHTLGVKF